MISFLIVIDYLVLPALVIFVGIEIYRKYQDRLLDYIALLVTAGFISELLKYLINSPRPESQFLFEGASFPSTHTTVAFASAFFYVLVCHSSKNGGGKAKIGAGEWIVMSVILFIAGLVASLRIILGAHYFVDIFAGIILGLIISLPFTYYDLTLRRIR